MEFNAKNTKRILLIISFTVLLYLGLKNIKVILGVFSYLFSLAGPIITGLCIAFVLNIIMSALEKKVFFFMDKSSKQWVRKLKRPISLVSTLLITLGIVALLLRFIIPELTTTITKITENLPGYIDSFITWLNGILGKINPNWVIKAEAEINWVEVLTGVMNYLFSSISSSKIINTATGVTTMVFDSLVDIVFSIIMACYVLAQKEKIGAFVKRMLKSILPDKTGNKIISMASLANRSFSSFVSGQLVEAVILGTLCFVGMLIFGFPYALVISIVIMVTALVPMVGAFIGVIVGGLLILTESPSKALLFVVFILVLQQLEGSLIYPRVVGKSVGLPGVLVFSAVIIGSNIGGFAGAMLAVPLCAMLYALLKEEMQNKKLKKKLEAGENFFKESESIEEVPVPEKISVPEKRPVNHNSKKKKKR